MRHFVIVGLLVIVFTALTFIGLEGMGLMPVQASAQAIPIDWMWNWQVFAMSFLFCLIVVPAVYSMIVFRRKPGDTTDAEHVEGNTTIEIIWTIVPLFAVLAFAYMGAYSLGETRKADPNAMIVKVTARQFAWSFEYPEYGFVSDQLILPYNRQILLQMESVDVIHSFWVPEFRVKQDLVPGRITEVRVTPYLVGEYKVRCSEICGTSHAYMEAKVIVEEVDAFDVWAAEQKALAEIKTPEGQGKNLATANGCFGCHSVTSSPLPTAPTWFGLFGAEVELADGSVVISDEAYLKESILNPKAKEVKGYSPTVMPAFQFTNEEIENLIAYMKTLK